jgi:hypothetical protein
MGQITILEHIFDNNQAIYKEIFPDSQAEPQTDTLMLQTSGPKRRMET